LAFSDISWWRLALAILVYAGFVGFGHEWLFGISPMLGG
jgi:hypothetical protein